MDWFKRFALEALGLRCHTNPAQPTAQRHTFVGLTLSKDVSAVVSMPIGVYQGDNKAIVTLVALLSDNDFAAPLAIHIRIPE